MNIVVDAFSKNNSPNEILKACSLFKSNNKNINIILAGNEKTIKKSAKQIDISTKEFDILDAKDTISAEENPINILNNKKESSMAIGLKALKNENIDAFITAGNTGALAAGSHFFVDKIENVKRAALAPILPAYNNSFLLLDAGANLECKEKILLQFAIMGKIYAEKILKIKNPKVGLANIGQEQTKGTANLKAAYKLLNSTKSINFIGNVEPRYIPLGVCDVIVADGLIGNVILKTMEGTAKFLIKSLKDVLYSSTKTKLAALLLKKDIIKLKEKLNYKNYGGAIFLGLKKTVIKAHGNSNCTTFENALVRAKLCVQQKINATIRKVLTLVES